MSDHHRDIEALLMDYAGALRDGELPTFLKSLTRQEAQRLSESPEFPEAAAMVRLVQDSHFSHRVAEPDIGLFLSRVDAKIGGRLKQSRSASPARRPRRARNRSSMTTDPEMA